MNNWQKLCEAVNNRLRHSHCSFKTEKCFENHLAEYLRYIFGWDFNEVKQQYTVQFGHEKNKYPDIVILQNEKPTIVFELKAYGQPLAGDEITQFQSYIKQLSARFGILTNSVALQLWYRYFDDDGNESLKPVLTLRFDKSNPDGKRLGELLTKHNYSNNDLAKFCDELITRKKKEAENRREFISKPANPFMEEQVSNEMDEKIEAMIMLYEQWLVSDDYEQEYCREYLSGMTWAKKNLLDEAKLNSMTDKEYEEMIRETPSHLTNLRLGFGAMQLFSTLKPGLLHDSHKAFTKAIHHLNATPKEDRFKVLQDLTNNPDYKIKGMGTSFWSEVIRCKFPDVPLVNIKTVDFFTALGLNIGVAPEERARNVGYCYGRWQQFHEGKIDMFRLSHMEHFAKESEEGRRYMLEKFGTVVGDNTY